MKLLLKRKDLWLSLKRTLQFRENAGDRYEVNVEVRRVDGRSSRNERTGKGLEMR